MPDRMTPEQRHDCMASIHSEDTRPEQAVRRELCPHIARDTGHRPAQIPHMHLRERLLLAWAQGLQQIRHAENAD